MDARVPGKQRVLLSCERRVRGVTEVNALPKAVVDLTREDEREEKQDPSLARDAVAAGGAGGPGNGPPRTPSGVYCVCDERTDAPSPKEMSPRGEATPPTRREDGISPSVFPRRSSRDMTDIQRVEVAGRAVTSMGLADVVEATLGSPAHPRQVEVRRRQTQTEPPRLWSLVLRQCQLSSLLPVAGLLYHLDGLVSLGLHEIAGLALAGMERVLADARCLASLAIRRCGLTRLPRLQSGSIETLDLSDNAIIDTSGLETLFRLKELDLSGNDLPTLLSVRSLVPLGAGSLRGLKLHGNPLQSSPRYRDSVVAMLPSIQLLDGKIVTRCWRPTGDVGKCTARMGDYAGSTCTTPPRARDQPLDGYFSDGAAREGRGSRRGGYARCYSGAHGKQGNRDDKHGFVRGLAGIGLIWGGTPRPHPGLLHGSSSACSSPMTATTPRERSGGRAFARSASSDGAFGESQRPEGIQASYHSSKRMRRPPSPERCRQMDADNTRSKPRANAVPTAYWDARFRQHHQQELIARDFATARKGRLSRSRQAATMNRLSQPLRLLEREAKGDDNGCGDVPLTAVDGSQAWNALFCEAVLAESAGLVDRPTALKGPDGRWQGVTTTTTGERKALTTARSAGRFRVSGTRQEKNRETVDLPYQRDWNRHTTWQSSQTTARTHFPSCDIREGVVTDDEGENHSTTPPRVATPTVSPAPRAQPTTPWPSTPPPRASLPSESSGTPPPRATIILADDVTSQSPTMGTGSSDRRADHSETGAESGHGGCPEPNPGSLQEDGQSFSGGDGRSGGGRRAASSPRMPRDREGSGGFRSGLDMSRRPRRTPRVLTSSSDFARAVWRVYKVELSEDDARCLFHKLDSDRDGALGAEDLLRGAPTVASFFANKRALRQDGEDRQVSSRTTAHARPRSR